ncbi:MAG: hypothetical protein OEV00_05385 [Acidobacteriota bacterium]|nr:hypothetical protein [Acidobacteriota bacterium]MDH3784747.1 hypothetical protein [Acidobacteriota bacterium]
MRGLLIVVCIAGLAFGCGGGESGYADEAAAPERVLIKYDVPEPMEVPEAVVLNSDDDWEGKVHNKDIEIVGVLNVINPIAAFITAGFEQYGDRFSDVLQEEWEDTQVQLTAALTLYESCKERRAAGEFDKQLFLDMEEVWQLLVKTGVAGVRTKSMVDSEVKRITAT